MNTALQLDSISKAFDGEVALSDAALSVVWGEVHALLGENGAGKSTLMNIVCGLYSADSGTISVNGRPVVIGGPNAATRYRIGMVHQHFKLVGPFTVAENILLVCRSALNIKTVREASAAIHDAAHWLGFVIDPAARTDTLSVAERQRVEIIKLMLLGADILILDEPTAVLTDAEADAVLMLLRELAAQGKAVVLITHRLREVARYADRVTIMRNGRTVLAGADTQTLDRTQLARLMVGEELHDATAPGGSEPGPLRLAVQALRVARADGSVAVDGVSFQLHAGEILGIAGVGGNGQTELAEAIFGLSDTSGGSITVDAEAVAGKSVWERRRLGLRLVPADRFAYALLAELRAYENLALTGVGENRYGPWWWLRRRLMRRTAAELFHSRQISGGGPLTRTRLLSGGNAQKLLLARELDDATRVLIAHSPTRGLDVRACQAVHRTLLEGVSNGAACLLISEDLDEVLQLATQVAVMSRGRLYGPFPQSGISRTRIGELMTAHA